MSRAKRYVNLARLPGVGDWWTPPDDDGMTDCPVCDAKGWRMVADEGFKPYREVCPVCAGAGLLDEDGQPYDRKQAETEREECLGDMRADR